MVVIAEGGKVNILIIRGKLRKTRTLPIRFIPGRKQHGRLIVYHAAGYWAFPLTIPVKSVSAGNSDQPGFFMVKLSSNAGSSAPGFTTLVDAVPVGSATRAWAPENRAVMRVWVVFME